MYVNACTLFHVTTITISMLIYVNINECMLTINQLNFLEHTN